MRESRSAVVLCTCDDNIRKAVTSTLEKAGFNVLTVPDAASALDLSLQPDSPVQLIIADTAAPSDFRASLGRLASGMRVLFLFDSSSQEAVAPPRGCLFLEKPFRRAHLLGKVLEAISEPLAFTA